jgi:hypothetical protein
MRDRLAGVTTFGCGVSTMRAGQERSTTAVTQDGGLGAADASTDAMARTGSPIRGFQTRLHSRTTERTMMSEQTTLTPAPKPSDLKDAPHEDVKGRFSRNSTSSNLLRSTYGRAAHRRMGKPDMLDIRGMLEQFKLPGFDLDGFLESRKLDIGYAGDIRSIRRRPHDRREAGGTAKRVLTEVGDALRKLPQQAAKPAEIIRKQQEPASEALLSALASMKEIAVTVGKSQSEILEIVSNRVLSNVEEIRNLAHRHQPDEKEIK